MFKLYITPKKPIQISQNLLWNWKLTPNMFSPIFFFLCVENVSGWVQFRLLIYLLGLVSAVDERPTCLCSGVRLRSSAGVGGGVGCFVCGEGVDLEGGSTSMGDGSSVSLARFTPSSTLSIVRVLGSLSFSLQIKGIPEQIYFHFRN